VNIGFLAWVCSFFLSVIYHYDVGVAIPLPNRVSFYGSIIVPAFDFAFCALPLHIFIPLVKTNKQDKAIF